MKNEMIHNACSYNKHLTKEFLEQKNFYTLLAFVGPRERNDFEKRYILGEEF